MLERQPTWVIAEETRDGLEVVSRGFYGDLLTKEAPPNQASHHFVIADVGAHVHKVWRWSPINQIWEVIPSILDNVL